MRLIDLTELTSRARDGRIAPRPTRTSVRQALRAGLLTLGLGLAWGPLPTLAQSHLPSLGDPGELTALQERKLGDRIIKELYRDPDYIDDAILQEYVQGIWHSLLKAARERGELTPELEERFAWQVLLGKDRTVNAFALPGGYLGLHLGLVAVVTSQDELASVLAHELSHVTQRHISRLMTQQKNQTPLLLGAMILGALAASKSPNATQALVVGGQALAMQNQLNFSRDMEREADRVGMSLMEPAGFAPEGFVSMFDKLQTANRLNDNGSWPYLRSHPLTSQRMADMHSRLPTGDATPRLQPVTMEHAMMAVRAKVLSFSGPDAWRQRVEEARVPTLGAQPAARQAAAWYGAALASALLRDADGAKRALVQLQRVTSSGDALAQRQVRLLQADVALRQMQPDAALASLPTSGVGLPSQAKGAPQGRPELLLRTQGLILQGQFTPAATQLQTWVTDHSNDAAAWQLLATAWQGAQQPLRAVRADAEAQAARYDYAAAVDRFKAGQDMARKLAGAADHFEASIIDTRLRAVESLLREQAAER